MELSYFYKEDNVDSTILIVDDEYAGRETLQSIL
jgi:hypothetical protein